MKNVFKAGSFALAISFPVAEITHIGQGFETAHLFFIFLKKPGYLFEQSVLSLEHIDHF